MNLSCKINYILRYKIFTCIALVAYLEQLQPCGVLGGQGRGKGLRPGGLSSSCVEAERRWEPERRGMGNRRACGPRALQFFIFFVLEGEGEGEGEGGPELGFHGCGREVGRRGGGGRRGAGGGGEVARFWFLQGVLGGGRRGGRNESGFGGERERERERESVNY